MNEESKYSRAAVSIDSVSAVAVICSLLQHEEENWKIKEINSS
jgi:hypothetical protein